MPTKKSKYKESRKKAKISSNDKHYKIRIPLVILKDVDLTSEDKQKVDRYMSSIGHIVVNKYIEIIYSEIKDGEKFNRIYEVEKKERSHRGTRISESLTDVWEEISSPGERYHWLSKKIYIANTIVKLAELKKTKDQEESTKLIIDTIQKYPEIIVWDDESIELCLLLALEPDEYKEFRLEYDMEAFITEKYSSNLFKQHVLLLSFFSKWGTKEEKEKSQNLLKQIGLPLYVIEKLLRGRPKGSYKYDKNEVRDKYKELLDDFKIRIKNMPNKKFQAYRLKVVKDFMQVNVNIVETLLPIISKYSLELSEQTILNRISEKLADLHPWRASKLSSFVTCQLYDISPRTLDTIISNKQK